MAKLAIWNYNYVKGVDKGRVAMSTSNVTKQSTIYIGEVSLGSLEF